MSEHLEVIKDWVDSLREDVEAVKRVVDCEDIEDDAREFAAAALNYLVTRMDLVPDWNTTIGVLDDVLVMRQCIELAAAYKLDEGLTDADAIVRIGKMGNDAARIEEFLGEELHAKFRTYCGRLTEQAVRGRTPRGILEDADARKALYEEVEDDIRRIPAAPFDDLDTIAAEFKAYLHHKLAS